MKPFFEHSTHNVLRQLVAETPMETEQIEAQRTIYNSDTQKYEKITELVNAISKESLEERSIVLTRQVKDIIHKRILRLAIIGETFKINGILQESTNIFDEQEIESIRQDVRFLLINE